MWKLADVKYGLYGMTESVMNASTILLKSHSSSTISIVAPALARVKVEPGLRVSIHLTNSTHKEQKPSYISSRSSTKLPSPSSTSDTSLRSTPSSFSSTQSIKPKKFFSHSANLLVCPDAKTSLRNSIFIPPHCQRPFTTSIFQRRCQLHSSARPSIFGSHECQIYGRDGEML